MLFLVLVAVVLAIIRVAADGLSYVLIIGIVVLVAALAFTAARWSQRSRRRPVR